MALFEDFRKTFKEENTIMLLAGFGILMALIFEKLEWNVINITVAATFLYLGIRKTRKIKLGFEAKLISEKEAIFHAKRTLDVYIKNKIIDKDVSTLGGKYKVFVEGVIPRIKDAKMLYWEIPLRLLPYNELYLFRIFPYKTPTYRRGTVISFGKRATKWDPMDAKHLESDFFNFSGNVKEEKIAQEEDGIEKETDKKNSS